MYRSRTYQGKARYTASQYIPPCTSLYWLVQVYRILRRVPNHGLRTGMYWYALLHTCFIDVYWRSQAMAFLRTIIHPSTYWYQGMLHCSIYSLVCLCTYLSRCTGFEGSWKALSAGHFRCKIQQDNHEVGTQTNKYVPAWASWWWNQYVPGNVQSCTAMYCHVLPCTAAIMMYCQSTYSYVLVRTFQVSHHDSSCLYQARYILVCTGMYCHFTKSTCVYIHEKNTRRQPGPKAYQKCCVKCKLESGVLRVPTSEDLNFN